MHGDHTLVGEFLRAFLCLLSVQPSVATLR
jgi:hypothetical protein